MEREPQGGRDLGKDRRNVDDEQPGALRDAAPDVLAPIDESAPVSGHTVAPARPSGSIAEAPGPHWSPPPRPGGPQGRRVADPSPEVLVADSGRPHSQPLVDEGPCGIPVVYALHAGGFDVIVNGDHLLSWGVDAAAIQDAALRNLAAWSAGAAWTDEVSGERRAVSPHTGR